MDKMMLGRSFSKLSVTVSAYVEELDQIIL